MIFFGIEKIKKKNNSLWSDEGNKKKYLVVHLRISFLLKNIVFPCLAEFSQLLLLTVTHGKGNVRCTD